MVWLIIKLALRPLPATLFTLPIFGVRTTFLFELETHLHSARDSLFFSVLVGAIATYGPKTKNNVGPELFHKNMEGIKAVYTTEKFGSGPVKKAVRTHNFCKETLEFPQGHRRLWPCRNSSVSLQKL